MKFRQVIKILKKPNWAIDINSITIHIWGYGKFPKLVLKMMKFYENKGKLIDADEALQLITHGGGSNEQ